MVTSRGSQIDVKTNLRIEEVDELATPSLQTPRELPALRRSLVRIADVWCQLSPSIKAHKE